MLELEKFGLVELNAQEQLEIDGGIAPLLLYFGYGFAGGIAIGMAKYFK